MEKAKALIEKYKAGTCNEAEKQLIDKWLFEIHSGETSDLTTEDFEQIQAGVLEYIEENKQKRKISKLWSRIAAAAAVLLIAGLSIFFYTSRHLEGSAATRDLLANDIKPGSNKAYLVLSNGKRLSLTDAANGELAKEAGVEITKTADGQVIYESRTNYSNALNTIETPKGGQYQVRLPDGSKVWLNAASKLIYPVSFNGRGQREVTLSGEAYFEVAKDKQHPFKVKSAGQEVEVLGTHFNVSSYPDEANVKTTLLEGSVAIRHVEGSAATRDLSYRRDDVKDRDDGVVLKPGQQATLQASNIKVTEVNTDYVVAWKDGSFVFNSENLESIMNQISRWYNVSVIYEDPSLKKETFFGTISKYENVSKVLNMLERTDVARFTIDGNTIKIKKKK
jgi:transmembrane sensor